MPRLADIGDSQAVADLYSDRVILVVEGSTDAEVLRNLVPHDALMHFEIRPPSRTGGHMAVLAEVREGRTANPKIYGLLDGEVAALEGGFETLVYCVGHTFRLPDPHLDGILFIAVHELENLLLLHGDPSATLAAHGPLGLERSGLQGAIAGTIRDCLPRYFYAALIKYASMEEQRQGRAGRTMQTQLLHDLHSREAFRARVKAEVTTDDTATWDTFTVAVARVAAIVRQARRSQVGGDVLLQLADGKHLLRAVRNKHGIHKSVEGHLVQSLHGTSYMRELYDELCNHTGISTV